MFNALLVCLIINAIQGLKLLCSRKMVKKFQNSPKNRCHNKMTSFWAQRSLTDEPLPLSIIVQYGFFISCNYTEGSKLLCKEKVRKHFFFCYRSICIVDISASRRRIRKVRFRARRADHSANLFFQDNWLSIAIFLLFIPFFL